MVGLGYHDLLLLSDFHSLIWQLQNRERERERDRERESEHLKRKMVYTFIVTLCYILLKL